MRSSTPDRAAVATIGLGARRRRWPPGRGRAIVRPAPPPGFGQRPPTPAPKRAHCRHELAGRALRATVASRAGWPSLLVLAGLVGLRGAASTSSWCSAAALLDRSHRDSPQRRLCRCWPPRSSPLAFDPVQTRLEALRRPGGAAAAGPRRTTCCGRFSGRVTGQLAGRGAARCGWPGCSPRAPAREWAQVWLVVGGRPDAGRDLAARAPRPELPARGRPGSRPTGTGRRSLPVRHGGELLGVLRGPGARAACR